MGVLFFRCFRGEKQGISLDMKMRFFAYNRG